jgi:tetratricopeptide (TPR) repeat protein
MKAERRHELQTNSLALWLRWRAPEIWTKHGSKILLGLIFVLLGIVLIRWRMNAPREAAARAVDDLTEARQVLGELQQGARLPGEATEVPKRIESALKGSDDAAIQADGLLLLGDYYWTLATLPKPIEATTRPSLAPELPKAELFSQAKAAYEKALKVPDLSPAGAAKAHFGLAVIAEQQGEDQARKANWKLAPAQNPHWAEARQHYQAILDNPKIYDLLKDQARSHIEELETLQKPLWLVPATQAAPTTRELLPLEPMGPLGPMLPPTGTTRPTTRPAGAMAPTATTRPTTRPATTPAPK